MPFNAVSIEIYDSRQKAEAGAAQMRLAPGNYKTTVIEEAQKILYDSEVTKVNDANLIAGKSVWLVVGRR